MNIRILHKSLVPEQISKRCPGAQVIDVTSKGPDPWNRFSPFFPHGGIPIPLWPGREAISVEGVWQGLKRFENEDAIDESSFENRTMLRLKRTENGRAPNGQVRGRTLGHQAGHDQSRLLAYIEARRMIFLPCYDWVLANKLGQEMEELLRLARVGQLVLLDYNVNGDIDDAARPLSHGHLVRSWMERL